MFNMLLQRAVNGSGPGGAGSSLTSGSSNAFPSTGLGRGKEKLCDDDDANNSEHDDEEEEEEADSPDDDDDAKLQKQIDAKGIAL